MGLIYSNARFLVRARNEGVSFDRTLTLGRQSFYVTDAERRQLEPPEGGDRSGPEDMAFGGFADGFFRAYLDAATLHSTDAADYQAADIIHDMNRRIGAEYEESYDVVIDGGTLEHVFNFPTALSNCLRMVKTGGSFISFTEANNHCGHGFYQFSPELFFRALTPENGFEIDEVVMVKHSFPRAEISRTQTCYRVRDPVAVGGRVQLVSRSPIGMMVRARKKEHLEPFSEAPQQSDYVEAWGAGRVGRASTGLKRRLQQWLPEGLANWLRGVQQLRSHSLSNRRFYEPW